MDLQSWKVLGPVTQNPAGRPKVPAVRIPEGSILGQNDDFGKPLENAPDQLQTTSKRVWRVLGVGFGDAGSIFCVSKKS